MSPVFALIDCNNFFVSCERLFRPDLQNKPVVVLSSNDGCVVARSNEAKELGVPMGAPAFKYKYLFKQHNIVTFSANFEIYGDISKRTTSLLATITPRIEVYSVDESFLDLSTMPIKDYAQWGSMVRVSILKNIGVPVSIGIATSKTLAKLGAGAAKKSQNHQGVIDLVNSNPEIKNQILQSTSVKDIWGIGRRLAPKLKAEGVSNAMHLSLLRPQHAQQLMGVHGRKLLAELNGISCHNLEMIGKTAQSIMRGRTFGEDTNKAFVLESAIASMTARAAFALRSDHLLARKIGFFVETNRHKPGYRQWAPESKLSQPSNDTGLITSILVSKLNGIYSNNHSYHRLGVFLYDLIPEDALQIDVFGQIDTSKHDKASARLKTVDNINNRFGRHKIYYAAEDLDRAWEPKYQIRSPRYVSNWDELPTARIKVQS